MRRIPIKGEIIPNGFQWLYDECGLEGTSPNKVKALIEEAQNAGEDFVVEINSGGGSVFAGVEIYSLLKPLNCRVEVVGVAASAASIIACAGKTVAISPVGQIMIHNCRLASAGGDKHDLQKVAAACGSVDEGMALAYKTKCGKTVDELLAMMDNETWLSAEKAKEVGLADEIMFQSEEGKEPEPARLVATASGLSVPPEVMELVADLKKQIANSNAEIKRLTATAELNAFMAKLKEGLE